MRSIWLVLTLALGACNANGYQIGSAAGGYLPDAQLKWIQVQQAQYGMPVYATPPATYVPPHITRCFSYGYQGRMQMCQ